MSSRIQVKPKELKELADLIKAEREDIITDPKNRLLMTMSTLSGVKYSERAYQSLNECIQAVDHYLAKLEESMIITKKAADDFRTEDEKERDQIKHLLYEFIGFNDLRRLGEYDPITHEKLTGKDRSIAMLSLTGGRFLKVLKIPGVKKFFNTLSTEYIAGKIDQAWKFMKHLPQSIHKWVPKGDGVGIGSKLQFADGVPMTTSNVYKAEKSGAGGIRTQGVGNTREKIRIIDGKKQYNVNGKWLTDKQFSALRQKAVRQAWKQERELVQKAGRGTRDWTTEEKQELLQTGKVKGYEGQHMKSANEYPDFAGDPDNIQFLKGRNMDVNEHLDAHGGNYQNPTNGYYDPKSGSMTDFREKVPWKHK